jgi:hypothetical protein
MKKQTPSRGRPGVRGTDRNNVPEHTPGTESSQDEQTVIAVVPKNGREEVRVSLSTYKGMHLVDTRVFAMQKDARDGERVPTKKGVAIKLVHLTALIEALQKADTEARSRGLLK